MVAVAFAIRETVMKGRQCAAIDAIVLHYDSDFEHIATVMPSSETNGSFPAAHSEAPDVTVKVAGCR